MKRMNRNNTHIFYVMNCKRQTGPKPSKNDFKIIYLTAMNRETLEHFVFYAVSCVYKICNLIFR